MLPTLQLMLHVWTNNVQESRQIKNGMTHEANTDPQLSHGRIDAAGKNNENGKMKSFSDAQEN